MASIAPLWLVLAAICIWKLRKQNDERNKKLGELVELSKAKAAPKKPAKIKLVKKKKPLKLRLRTK